MSHSVWRRFYMLRAVLLDPALHDVNGQHHWNFSFWTHSHLQTRRTSADIYDELGFVNRVKLSEVARRLPERACVICEPHHRDTLQKMAQHIFDAHGPLVERGPDPVKPCPYSWYSSHTASCSNTTMKYFRRLYGALGDCAYHILSDDAFMCHCGLLFSSIQLLAVHYLTCAVQQPTTCRLSLNL